MSGSTSERAHAAHGPKGNLYQILEIEKAATDEDIKKAYRKLALKYHPDKNINGDPALTEKFKEINHAHAVLSNPQKRKVYDEYGEMGLKMMDQFGDETMQYVLKPWVKWVFWSVACLTCGFFGCCCGCLCCCQCCCNFCCGKCKPDLTQYEGEYPDINEIVREGAEEDVVTTQPNSGNTSTEGNQNAQAMPSPNTPIVLGPPPSASSPSYGATSGV
ncbi:CBN-DNJ-14 protein [Aphelenchoides avenae]|nr:CBN-DNJ-14 protein [Aphelenchus avenae]